MKNFAKKVQRFLVSEDGPTAVEYAVSIGTNANATFTSVAGQLGS